MQGPRRAQVRQRPELHSTVRRRMPVPLGARCTNRSWYVLRVPSAAAALGNPHTTASKERDDCPHMARRSASSLLVRCQSRMPYRITRLLVEITVASHA